MKSTQRIDRLLLLLQLIFVFFLPLLQLVSVVCIILLLIVSIFSLRIKESFLIFSKEKVLWIFVAFYLLHVIGIFYSDNIKYGLLDLETKLSYIIFPLMLPAVLLFTGSIQEIKWAFIAGNTSGALICLVLAVISYAKDSAVGHFFYTDYSFYLHTTYFSMYLNLAVLFLLEDWMKSKDSPERKWVPLLILFLTVNIILLFSRTAMVVSFFTIALFLVANRNYWIRERPKKVFLLLASAFLLLVQLTVFHYTNRFEQVEQVLQQNSADSKSDKLITDSIAPAEDNSTSTRLRLWESALVLIKKNPLTGVGTGDIKDQLMLQYAGTGYKYGVKSDLNPHNQYLHTGVSLGLVGLILLLAFFIVPLVASYRLKNWIYFCFMIILILNSLTESIMEVQKGVLWIAFFYVLLCVKMNNREGSPAD